MKIKEIMEKIAILKEALKHARSYEETISIQFEINRLETLGEKVND